jgi:hypothetical protein
MGVQVLVTDPNELEAIRQREIDITKERIQMLLGAGANVVLCSKVGAGSRVLLILANPFNFVPAPGVAALCRALTTCV